MSSESETPVPPEAPKPAFKIGAAPAAPASATPPPAPAAARPAPAPGLSRPPMPVRSGTAAPARVTVPVEENKSESPLFVVIDFLAAAAAITFAVILYQIHAAPVYPL